MIALALAGCAPARGPRPIAPGTPCANCGMGIANLRYACEDERAGAFRAYDSIECLLGAGPRPDRAWLADYDTRALHDADSLWVVQADIPSPMGGGYAAFLDRSAAAEIATAKHGRFGRLLDFAPGAQAPGAAADSSAASAFAPDSAAGRP
jgi:nitrous oxide reductase accessory protein NosL